MPSFTAIVFIGACIGVFARLVPSKDVPIIMWPFIFTALVAGAAYSWKHPKAPQTPSGWLTYVIVAIAGGAVLFVIDSIAFGLTSGHVIVDIFAVVSGVILAVAGSIRSRLLGQKNDV